MNVHFFEEIESVKALAMKTEGSLIWFHADPNYNNEMIGNISNILSTCNSIVGGGHFPHVIFGDTTHSKGNLLLEFDSKLSVDYFDDISNPKLTTSKLDDISCFALIVDGYSDRLEKFTMEVFNQIGNKKCVGGGAGDLCFEQLPVVFTPDGVMENVGQCIYLNDTDLELSSVHGWRRMSDPLRVTKTDGKRIIEINNKKAEDVYKEIVSPLVPHADWNNFFDVAKSFPFGVKRYDDNFIIRDIITAKDGVIDCLNEIEEHSFIFIMTGDKDSLVQPILKLQENVNNRDVFVVDCVSRVLFLGDDFSKEMSAIKNNDNNVFGVSSFGEIINPGDSVIDFMNKTCVLGVVGE